MFYNLRVSKAKKVLLIDDNFETKQLYKSMLEDNGISVESSSDSLEGFQLATENEYDLILLDLMMPKMDGLTMLNELKKIGKEDKVMLITNLAENAIVNKARKFNIKGVIMKSDISPANFVEKVTNAIK